MSLVGFSTLSCARRSARAFAFTAALLLAGPDVRADTSAYDAKPWLEDLDQTGAAMQSKYANLEWLVFEREVDLPALFADTRGRLESATSEAEARAAFDRLARKLGDGHVQFRWPQQNSVAPQAPKTGCAAIGLNAGMQGPPAASLIPGYTPLNTAPISEFPAGTLKVAGHKLGVVKIGVFTPQGYPELCPAALAALDIAPDAACDEDCADRVQARMTQQMTLDLMEVLADIRRSGAQILLVDIAGNGGGTEWAEAAMRMMTRQHLRSARLQFVRGEHWARNFADIEADLRNYARDAKSSDRNSLLAWADAVAERRHEAETPCDSGPLWQGKQPGCRWLGDAFYSSGILPKADPDRLKSKPWASLVFKPVQFPYREGVWRGPLIVLVDAGTGSAAEQFTAILQDNHAAAVLGAPTVGAGCGHTNGGTPTTLSHSGAVLELPDCVRLRADGSNEVMGIQPDVLVGLRSNDGPHRRGLRIAEKLPDAIAQALRRSRP
jgi:hypothetical protein